MNNLIQLSNINKSFVTKKKINVLKKINYKFNKGKIYSLIGPSGSGKSTLLNILSLIDRPSSGSIAIENNYIDFKNSKKNDLLRAKKIGIIYQDNNLLSDFTTTENIYLSRLSIDENKNKALEDAKKLIRKLGLTNRENHLASELSGGEMQRVAIARAISMKPKYLFCDEPNSGLDPQTAIIIDNLIQEITQEYKITTIVNTHDMNSVMEIGDNIAFIHQGKLAWQGNKDSIINSDSKELNDFVFASKLFKKLKK